MIQIPFPIEKCILACWFGVTYIWYFFHNCPERTCPIHTSDIPCSKSHVHCPLVRSIIQRISPCPKLLVNFRTITFYGEELLAPRPTPKLEDHPLSAVRDCLLNIFAATLHIWRPFPPSATWGRAMPWWQATHLLSKHNLCNLSYLTGELG
jgi:hypothetical protein